MKINIKNLPYIYNRCKEQILYLVFGVLTTAISILTYMVFTEWLCMDVLVANLLSWVTAVTFAFLTNRKWVFGAKGGFWVQVLAFFGGRLFTLGVEELLLWLLVERLLFPSMAVKIILQILIIILNYVISKLIVFRKNKEEKTQKSS